MSGELTGRVVLVTGGARGLGKAISRAFLAEGAQVVVNYFHAAQEAPRVRDELAALGPVELIRASVADRGQVDAMFDTIAERHGGLDVLVNNAAAGALLPLDELAEPHWRRALDTNLRGTLWCSLRAAELMTGRQAPAIVNLSSLGSSLVISDYVTVGTSKAAVEALTRYLAVEFAPRGIRVNTASGGLLDGAVATLFPDAGRLADQVRAATPLGHRLGSEDELAALVRFLASPGASWITGQTIVADGGLSLGAHMLAPAPAVPAAAPADGRTIAVVGMGVVTPGANNPDELRQVLDRDRHVFTEPVLYDVEAFHSPDQHAEDKTYTRRSGFVTGFVPHPRLAAELRDGTVPSRESTTLWLRHSVMTALESAEVRPTDRCLAVLGYTADGSQELEERLVLAGYLARMRDLPTAATGAMRGRYDRLGGPASEYLPHRIGRNAVAGLLPDDTEVLMVDTACSSALYAVDLGVKALVDGTADVVVCGGAFAYSARNLVLFSKLHGLSTSGEVRSFDQGAAGVLFSDGAGVVVLKRLDRARADGEAVLGVVEGVGLSCDGRGKAIYAPNADGQELALRRAYTRGGVDPASVDWVIAHATGTRAGDSTELDSLHRVAGEGGPAFLSSNKPIVGHTGWTAGLVSLVQALLGLRDGRVPAQRYLTTPIPALDGSRFTPPRAPAALPARRTRHVGVSAFGFGGTNAHLVLADEHGGHGARHAPGTREPVVLVGWAVDVPGDRDAAARWLRGDGEPPAPGFGEEHPLPGPGEVLLPPATLRNMDRAQTVLLRAAARLDGAVRAVCAALKTTTGVVVGHMGPTRRAVHYALRCYLDDLRACTGDHLPADRFAALRASVRTLVPPSTEDAFPGIMPNIVPARLAAHAGYQGLNLTVDTGPDSALDAVRTAERYLRHGDLDVALVAGVNGNSTGELAEVLAEPRTLAEGAFLAVLVRESTARRHGLPVLAEIRTDHGPAGPATRPDATVPLRGSGRTYLGADPMVALLAMVRDVEAGGAGGWVGTAAATGPRVAVTKAGQDPSPVRRFTTRLVPAPPLPTEQAFPPLPDHALVLVARPGLLDGVPVPPTTRVVVAPGQAGGAPPEVAALTALLPDPAERIDHVRVVADLGAGGAPPGDLSAAERLRTLHDLAYLAAARWTRSGTSYGVLLTDAVVAGVPHPAAGLFTGLVKALAREEPDAACRVLVTDAADAPGALPALAAEFGADTELPVTVHSGPDRLAYALAPADGPAGGALPLDRDSVVVAAGGGRGLTAELLVAVAARAKPTVYVLGRQAPGPAGDHLPRTAFIAAARDDEPGRPVADLVAEYDRHRAGAEVRRTLDRLAAHCGADRVHHLVCDVTDPDAVRAAVDRVHAGHGRVDLLVNAAGVHRGGTVRATPLAGARPVRDTKLLGYVNLRRAFAGRAPRLWHNFGSLLAVLGWAGEADYCSGNEVLNLAAQWHRRFGPAGEQTIAWALWDESGFAAEPLTRDLLRRRGELTGLSDRDGVARWLDELTGAGGAPDAVVTYLGDAELTVLGNRRPAAFLVHRTSGDGVEWRPDPRRDGYLRHHVLNGVPSLPASVVAELAVQAAGLRGPVSVRAAAFHFPVTGRRPHHLRTGRPANGGAVTVRVLSDLTAPDGTVFRRDLVHAELTVAPAGERPTPLPGPRPEPGDPAVPRHYAPGGRIELSGPFACLTDVALRRGGATARFAPRTGEWTATFAAMTTPALLVDALVQLVLLATAPDGLDVPVGVDRVDVWTPHNDVALLEREGNVALVADRDTGTAYGRDGAELVRVSGVRTTGATPTSRQSTELEKR